MTLRGPEFRIEFVGFIAEVAGDHVEESNRPWPVPRLVKAPATGRRYSALMRFEVFEADFALGIVRACCFLCCLFPHGKIASLCYWKD